MCSYEILVSKYGAKRVPRNAVLEMSPAVYSILELICILVS